MTESEFYQLLDEKELAISNLKQVVETSELLLNAKDQRIALLEEELETLENKIKIKQDLLHQKMQYIESLEESCTNLEAQQDSDLDDWIKDNVIELQEKCKLCSVGKSIGLIKEEQ